MRTNPFNFRRPIDAEGRLPGRSWSLGVIRDSLRSLANREPEHLVLIGPRRIGKTSLLFSARRIASQFKALPVLVPITTSALREVDGLFTVTLATAEHALRAEASEQMPPPLPAPGSLPLVDCFRDMARRAIGLGFEAGLAILLDNVELIGEADTTYQDLAMLAEHVPECLFIFSGEPFFVRAVRRTYPPLLDRVRVLHVGGLPDPGAVLDLLTHSFPPGGRPAFEMPVSPG